MIIEVYKIKDLVRHYKCCSIVDGLINLEEPPKLTNLDFFKECLDTVEEGITATEKLNLPAEFAKHLMKLGLGEYIVGRLGYKSRVKWLVPDIRSVLRDAIASVDDENQAAPPPPQEPFKEHLFELRAGFVASIKVPMDVTADELNKLCSFISLLPEMCEEGN